MKLINNLNNINTCFSNGYELRGSMGNRQSHNNGLVMNGSNSNHLTRSTTRSQLKEPLTVECNGFVNSVSVRSDGVLVEKDAPGRLCRSKSKSCPGNGSQLGPLSPTDVVRPRRNIWKLPSCLLGTTAEDGRSNTTGTRTQCPVKTEANKTECKSNEHTCNSHAPCKYAPPSLKPDRGKCDPDLQEDSNPCPDSQDDRKHKQKGDRKFLEDNREYYKVEVLSAKLRSTRQYVKEYETRKMKEEAHENQTKTELLAEQNGELSNPSSEEHEACGRKTRQSHGDEDKLYLSRKNLKLRHSLESPQHEETTPVKRARPNKVSKIERLNMEADKFMFGDPRRELEEQESSPDPDPDQIAPKRKRKSQVELFLIDNLDYYKFQLPASRLRNGNDMKVYDEECTPDPVPCKGTIRIDFDAVKYSFEMGIEQELWYQVFLRSRSRTKQSLWQNKVPHQSKILLPFERKSRPSTKSKQSVVPPPPPPPPPPEPEPIAPPRRRKRRLSSIIEEDSRPRKSPRCHASTQAILSSTPGQAPIARRSVYSEDGSYTGDVECTPLHEPDNFPECCEFARTNPYSCNVRRLVDKLAQQLNLNTAQLNLCEVLREYSRSYYASLSSSQPSCSQPGDNSSECGGSSHQSWEGVGRRGRPKKRRINMTGWPCRPKRKAAGKILNYNENLAASMSTTACAVPPPSLSPAPVAISASGLVVAPKKKRRRKKQGKASNRYKY
ncbi:hypothetical protein M8J77_008517 [Diaphorina citri]|nr:hypothetical protein M8J77_008517 [Diaphorina citri]